MIPIEVKLCKATTPQRPAAGWLVRGDTAEAWLAVAAACPGDAEQVRILPIAEDAALLLWEHGAVPPSRTAGFEGDQSLVSDYGFAAARVLLPVEAIVEPPLTAEEWAQLPSEADTLFVWHPSQGLIRFDRSEQLTIGDLLTAPAESAANWSLARTAPTFVDRLWSVVSAEPLPTMADVETEWMQEISGRKPLDGLPRLPNETSTTWTEHLAMITAKWRVAWRRWFPRRPSSKPSQERGTALGGGVPEWLGLALVILVVMLILFFMRHLDPLTMLFVIGMLWLFFQGLGSLGGRSGAGRSSGRDRTKPTAAVKPPSRWSAWMQSAWQRLAAWTPSASPGNWLRRADEAMRRREVDRLLYMLDQQPDEGLQYAIPFGGDPGRGRIVAGNELVRRDWKFGLAGGGGGPTDWWNIDPMQQLKLQQRYRDLAEREQQRGRYRRAAYIYSQLLGDWLGAATALKAGHFYAEAAVIYQDRLNNLPQAAACYELAGQPHEALRIFQDQKLWVAAGDLCERLGRSSEAQSHYRSAVSHWLFIGEVHAAVDVLETKLQDIDGALHELERTWPGHQNAAKYFDLWFTVAARHHRHAAAENRLEKLTADRSTPTILQLLPRLQQIWITYPDASIQHCAKEGTLRLVSDHLPAANAAESRLLAAYLPGLSPSDRLLPRDCQRYVDRRREALQGDLRKKLPVKPQLCLERRFMMVETARAELTYSSPLGWITFPPPAASTSGIVFTTWDARTAWNLIPEHCRVRAVAVDGGRREIWLEPPGADFTIQWPGEDLPWRVTFPAFLPRHWLAVKTLPSGISHVLWVDDFGAAWLTGYTSQGATCRSQRFAEEWTLDPASVDLLLRRRSSLWKLGDDHILAVMPVSDHELVGECYDDDGTRIWSSAITGREIAGPMSTGASHALVVRPDGVALYNDLRTPGQAQNLSTGWCDPAAAFLPGGLVAVADGETLSVFPRDTGKSVLTLTHSAPRPLALAAAGIGRFSVLRETGEVELWGWSGASNVD